jgi:hypothetical protein
MSSIVKIRLQRGDRSIDVEATTYEEASKIIDRYWNIEPVSTGSQRAEPRKVAKTKTSRSNTGEKSESADSKINAADWANKIKEDDQLKVFEEKILHKDDVYNKTAFVSWFLEDIFITSGDIHRILEALNVKIEMGTISNCLKRTSRNFIIQNGQSKKAKRYKLTGPSRKEVQKLIDSDESER